MKQRLLSVLTVTAILAAGYLAHRFSPKSDSKLVADVGSRIRLVACSLTSARTSSLRNSELISNIINGLPKDVHVLLFVNDRDSFKHSMGDRHVAFIEMPPGSDISIWPQDPFVVLHGESGNQLVVPREFGRENDDRMPIQLGKLLELEVVQSDLLFEGGNIVCGEQVVFLGADTIALNIQSLQISADEATDQFARLFGRPILVLGESPQSIGHIDMVVTPLENNVVLVADSRAGATIASTALKESATEVSQFETQCEDSFFGRADIQELLDRDGNRIERPEITGKTAQAIAASLELAPKLDQIAKQLTTAGYQVQRMPALIPPTDPDSEPLSLEEVASVNPGTRTSNEIEITEASERSDKTNPRQEESRSLAYPFLTYNNVLIEKRGDQPTVYLPQYGFRQLDQFAYQRWQEMGFEVQPIEGFSTSAMYGGAMRCCTKVLLRD